MPPRQRLSPAGEGSCHHAIQRRSAIVATAHSLNLKVTVEGVETAEQQEFLHARHCDAIQGYLLTKPLSADRM
jgi:EAL domain-containing protein (putative c-di-GMP-specific phosphodiesterase class I)